MPKIRIAHVWQDRDRHGNLRTYLALPGRRKVRLREDLGSPAFWAVYHAEIAKAQAAQEAPDSPAEAQQGKAGSLLWLCRRWYASGEFQRLGPSTRRNYRRILERCCQVRDAKGTPRGAKPYRALERHHVVTWRDALSATPEAANGLVKVLRKLFNWALDDADKPAPLAEINPAAGIKKLNGNGEGWHPWSLGEVEAYIKRHPFGTKAYLALALLMFSGVRRSDVVKLMPPTPSNPGWMRFTETKGAGRKLKVRELPVMPEMQRAAEACPSGHLTYLVTEYGKPFTAAGFGNWFKDRCREAGLDHCSAHGVRKFAATNAADEGATAHELMAIFGWENIVEAERYTKQADRKRLAGRALRLLRPEGFGDADTVTQIKGKEEKG